MKRLFFLSVAVAVIFCPLKAGLCETSGPEERFFKANQQYAEGNYQEAIDLYEVILRTGLSSGPLHYNLGNAYFKLGQRGKAILHYERARRLMPQDEDLLANLSFVTSLLEQAQPAEGQRWYERAFFDIRDLFSATGWTIVFLFLYTLFFILLLLAIFMERIKTQVMQLTWIFLCVALVSLIFTSAKIHAAQHHQEGVIIQKVVDVRYSPALTGAVAFRLHEGVKAQVIRWEGNWCYIRLTRDKSGWVERATIEVI